MSKIHRSRTSISRLERTAMLCQEILLNELQAEKRFLDILYKRKEIVQKYEGIYNDDSPDGHAVDSKRSIQCLSSQIDQLVKERKFYYLIQSIKDILFKIEYHFENFSHIRLEENIFSSIKNAIEIHTKSLNILRSAVIELPNMSILNDRTKKHQMERWATLLEEFAEELKFNILFFPFEALSEIEQLCNNISLKTTNKKTVNCKREEYRRRLHYAASFILSIVDHEFASLYASNQESNQDNQECDLFYSPETIKLNAQESKSFVDDLLNPPLPNEALRRAALHYKEVMSAQ